MKHFYLIALGSNMRHGRYGAQEKVIAAALDALEIHGVKVVSASRVIQSTPVGPSRRRYANSAAVVRTSICPQKFLDVLQEIEADFGRNRRGMRWSARVLDLDIVLWNGGIWASPTLSIPHNAFRDRDFVLRPAVEIASDWRDPISGFTTKQLLARLTKRLSATR